MFQSFDAPPADAARNDRPRRLAARLADLGLDAFLVPRADEHQGEYVPRSAARLRWLTGFTGSAGMAVLTARHGGALFVDGRYTVQARGEIDPAAFEVLQVPAASATDWIAGKLAKGAVVGLDPWLHTLGAVETMTRELARRGVTLKAVAANPLDALWGGERPRPPAAAIQPHPAELAGRTARSKIADVRKRLKADGQDAVVLTLPDSIAWLFNIRGSDVPHNPVALAFAILPAVGRPELFVAPAKVGAEARAHLAPVCDIRPPDDLAIRVADLAKRGARIRLDPDTAAAWCASAAGGAERIARGADPCIALKAVKNAAEIRGTRAAHLRDGVAMARFLAWLDRTAPKGTLDEIGAVKALERFRRDTGALREISFDTISGSGPNGAIVHYRVNEASNRRLRAGELFLVDSGGQYQDGTTDITRTIAIGPPTAEMRERFTLVLKGHIAIATARFPKGTRGIELDPFARRALWDRGLDFDHGTGHGVGSYLSVHEGPQSISRRGMAVLEAGMIVSNEPGYYKEGAYGIRLENLVLVTPARAVKGGDREMLAFETLTLAPFDLRLVEAGLLSPAEIAWLDAYHARVARVLGPHLAGDEQAWLEAATRKVG